MQKDDSSKNNATAQSHCPHGRKKAFTLAETMLTVVILGIIAAIILPNAIMNATQKSYKTKLKKALYVYDTAVQKIIIENDVNSLNSLMSLNDDDCSETSRFFKKKQGTGCVFETFDGLWWNISNIEKAYVAFERKNLTEEAAASTDNSAFYFLTIYNNEGNSFSTNNLELEEDEDNRDYMRKLYTFVGYR
ncbi:prepilin-type N-terminal cleavage/methylation domain-containing protein [bacterium]|nr:prepilin-type N-terminal cleavage/methylation domain-containing protein [bacterium]